MRNLIIVMASGLLALSACTNTHKNTSADTSANTPDIPAATETLQTVMSVPPSVKAGEPVMLTFTVYNRSAKALEFCKWHTPFEGFIAAFLDVRNSNGEEVLYRGAMAKRVMPPPAEAYIQVPAGDSATVDIDLLKGYDLSAPGKYHAVYQAGGMSGLEQVNELDITVVP
ncbi:protease [Chitinophaga sp. XS-30]|uniref:protease n=1 Tax=Chitinophaga sp. XS-30 TaxID=2604421 RepID=UPI0011DE3B67|nr:protease [Chitinophaga sp. XS-30]QEH42755.1 protease [Chitinophaga sp. XS-30]